MQESLEVPSHGIPNAHTGHQPDMMWRTNAVEIEQLTHCQQLTFTHGVEQFHNHRCEEHIRDNTNESPFHRETKVITLLIYV